MKKLFMGLLLFGLAIAVPIPTMAGVDVNINIGLPPPIVFAAPPEMIVLPETYVYVVPDVDVDIFFYGGWWWRSWEGRWYRSRYYNSGWGYYRSVPSFYVWIPSDWRNDYREHRWGGRPWNYQRIPHQQVQQNWRTWEKTKHWEKQQTWGVEGLKPRKLSKQPPQKVQPKSQAKPIVQETDKPKIQKMDKPESPKVGKPESQKVDKPERSKKQKGRQEKGEVEK